MTTGDDDRDEMGLCIEPSGCVIGLEPFEQYQFRTQPEGVRSGRGDLDLVIYSLRKWARLAAQGNPTVLLLLFVPKSEIVRLDRFGFGAGLPFHKDLFLSRDCGRRFVGYLQAQREQMLGLRSRHTNRPELIEVYGYDTKFAYHAVRLGLQGVELLSTGKITLPIPEPHRGELTAMRHGGFTKKETLEWIADLQNELQTLTLNADLPESADYPKINRWLSKTYREWWVR